MEFNDEQRKGLEKFCDTAMARYRIYCHKEAGKPKPWTEDPIFQTYYFCNTFRVLDKTTVWINENIIKAGRDVYNLWEWILLARMISNERILQEMKDEGFLFKPMKEVSRYFRVRFKGGRTVVGNAFIINSKISAGGALPKCVYLFYFLDKVRGTPNVDRFFLDINTMEEMYQFLLSFEGVGPFMAYQYTLDFSFCPKYLGSAPDKREFLKLGVGAERGIARIVNGRPDKKPPKSQYKELVVAIRDYWQEYVKDWLAWRTEDLQELDSLKQSVYLWENLLLTDVQHWLCEFDKYARGGSKKRRYNGRS